jgi:DNA-binding response OmpR family regulator
MRILLVEDDEKAARLLGKGLREEGFVVDVAPDGNRGDELIAVNTYDVVILDWLLPGKDGIAICRDLRARGLPTPILMLTARDALSDRVRGLNTGADDYLTKPFAFAELLARIHALLRRSELTRPVVLQVETSPWIPAAGRCGAPGTPCISRPGSTPFSTSSSAAPERPSPAASWPRVSGKRSRTGSPTSSTCT